MSRLWIVAIGLCAASLATADVRVVETDAEGLRLVLEVEPGVGPAGQRIAAAGHPRGAGPDGVDLPFVATLLAAPPGARLRLDVRSEERQTLSGIELLAADSAAVRLDGTRLSRLAHTEYVGVLRGVPAHRLQLFPWQFDPATRRLVVHRRLVVDVTFVGGGAGRPTGGQDRFGQPLRGAFANPPSGPWRAAAPAARRAAADDWYDSAQPWIRMFVDVDGVYRVTPAWLRSFDVAVGGVDPRTLRVVHAGVEQRAYVPGADDGAFDDGDELLFYGRYRRAVTVSGERDHESEYGPRETYWLTWGGQPGQRFDERDASTGNGYSRRRSYLHAEHHEIDRSFDQLGFAPDSLADRWFDQRERPLRVVSPTTPSSQTFHGDITGLYDDEEYEARVEIALQGNTGAGFGEHHTVVKFNDHELEEAYWAGQVSRVIDATVPSSWLRSRNRVLLQGFADRIQADEIWFNWFRVTYRRQFHAYPGFVAAATEAAPEGHLITIEGFRHRQIELFDVANGVRLTGLLVGLPDSLYQATFEDAPPSPARYVAVDSLSVRSPEAAVDIASDWRSGAHGADYVVIAHPDFLEAGRRLAEHRRGDDMEVAVVSTQNLYDEFTHGRFQREAIADFIDHAYWNWDPRPAYVVLLGDATWDYRGVYTGNRDQKLLPTSYYLAPERGYSPADYQLSLVDGDDLLADLSIGRLAVDSADEAERVVTKVITYDRDPAPGDWRGRAVYAAGWHAKDEFTDGLDSLATLFTEPVGLTSLRIYSPDEAPLPNPSGKAFLDALNDGALVVNFSGHGAAGAMFFLFASFFPDWEYMNQLSNGPRLPLMLALSCLNGLFTDPRTEGLSELMTEHDGGGAIAAISATALSGTAKNGQLSGGLYRLLFAENQLQFGPALDVAKARVLAAHSSFFPVVQTMQLFGDPAQKLALPLAADYAAVDLTVHAQTVTTGAAVTVTGQIGNHGRLGADSLTVAVVGHAVEGAVDTLWRQRRGPFAGSDSLRLQWSVDRRGPYRIELIVDSDDGVAESDETDNRIDVLVDIVHARRAEPLTPADGGRAGDLTVVALAPVNADGGAFGLTGRFALSSSPGFADSATVLSPSVAVETGRLAHTFAAGVLPEGPVFWRVQLHDAGVAGPWSPSRSFVVGATADSGLWQQRGLQLLETDRGDGSLGLDGSAVRLSATRPAFQPAAATRELELTTPELAGAGVLATDGTYLYAKRWYNDASTVYAGSDGLARIGTGYGGTEAGRFYGWLADSTSAGISATYHGDGYLYSDAGQTYELERIDPRTGVLDTVTVADGLVDWKTGRVVERPARGQAVHAMITSDGRYVYNVSMSSEVGMRVGWRVRVFEPQASWRRVREFVAPPTETGFTYLWTDGVFADGERLYFVEFGGQRRIRAVSAVDGRLLDEWTSDQEETQIIGGQYDPINDRLWLSALGRTLRPGRTPDSTSAAFFRYRRAGERQPGHLWSPPIGPAAAWGELAVDGAGVKVTVESETDSGWAAVPGVAVDGGGRRDLSGIDVARLRLAARIDTMADAHLSGWNLEYMAMSDLEVAAAGVSSLSGGVRAVVRNRGRVASAVATVRLETATGRLLDQLPVPSLAAGQLLPVTFDSLLHLPEMARVRVLPGGADGNADNDVQRLGDLGPRLTFHAGPEGQRLRDGDPLGRAPLSVQARGQGVILLAVDGVAVAADSVWTTAEGAAALFRLDDGRHVVQARLTGTTGELAVSRITIVVSDGLAAANILVHPHPVGGSGAAFTFNLSRAALVEVELYGLSGRRIRRLGPASFSAGFGQLPWDGRDDGGQPLAAGPYLYVLTARADGLRVQHRAPLVLAP